MINFCPKGAQFRDEEKKQSDISVSFQNIVLSQGLDKYLESEHGMVYPTSFYWTSV